MLTIFGNRASRWFRRRWAGLVENLYPVACLYCAAPLTGRFRICPACESQLPWLGRRQCPRCARPGTDPHAPCGRCQRRPPAFATVYAALQYTEPVPDWVQDLKYRQHLGLAPTLGQLIAEGLVGEGDPGDLIVPVALHRQRLARRGFNQAQLLGRELRRTTALPMDLNALQRTRATRPQVTLTDDHRGTNVRGAFRAQPARVRSRRILLVDDVITTGATVDAAAEALLAAGAKRVAVAAIARA